jgi:hypothetical protein
MENFVAHSNQVRLLLGCVALALLVLIGLAVNVARLGPVISREIQRAQIDYMQQAGNGGAVEANALRLGQCLQREMVRSAHAGFVYSDTWAVSTRVRALPDCLRALPALPSPLMARSARAQNLVVGLEQPRLASTVNGASVVLERAGR